VGARRRHVLVCALLAAAPVAALSSAAARAATLSPVALVAALQHARVTTGELPHGYGSPVVGSYAVTAAARSHHAVGGAQIQADHGGEAIIYIVFASAADAQADWAHGDYAAVHHRPAPSSIPQPNIELDTSSSGVANGTRVTIGLTDIACRSGNVIVEAATSSQTSTTHGDVAGAVLLERFALAHLRAVS
jgi:hypothetical protein